MNGRTARTNWGKQATERGVIAGPAGLERKIAVDENGGRAFGQRDKFMTDDGEMFGHVHPTRFCGGISGDMRVGEQCKQMFVARLAEDSGMNARCEHEAGTRQNGAFYKLPA